MRLILILKFLCLIGVSHSFVPATVLKNVMFKLEGRFKGNLGKVSESFTHDEITKEGLIQAVVQYFYDQPGGSQKINLTKIPEYYDVRRLYYDYYGKGLCNDNIPFYKVVQDFESDVASIDFNSATKDLPYAHFDAEKFYDSNERVKEYFRQINFAIRYNEFKDARKKAGQILHTIQDFYSHSNWVESDKSEILSTIGTDAFNSLPTSVNDADPCIDDTINGGEKCTLIEEKCGFWATVFATLVNGLGLGGEYVDCPLKYYNCTDNILILDKLVSGFYTGQETNDGTPVQKPTGKRKCSHGGILDGSSFKTAEGGINKDSGYTVFSPHAQLHIKASQLAIAHTKKMLTDLRTEFGDAKFSKFLLLSVDNETLNSVGDVPCSTCTIRTNNFMILSFLFLSFICFLIK